MTTIISIAAYLKTELRTGRLGSSAQNITEMLELSSTIMSAVAIEQ